MSLQPKTNFLNTTKLDYFVVSCLKCCFLSYLYFHMHMCGKTCCLINYGSESYELRILVSFKNYCLLNAEKKHKTLLFSNQIRYNIIKCESVTKSKQCRRERGTRHIAVWLEAWKLKVIDLKSLEKQARRKQQYTMANKQEATAETTEPFETTRRRFVPPSFGIIAGCFCCYLRGSVSWFNQVTENHKHL